jgi:hypothetical protein
MKFINLRLSWQIREEKKLDFLNPGLDCKKRLEMCERKIEQKSYRLVMTFNKMK